LEDVVARHEVLRTRYPVGSDGLPFQRILPAGTTVDWAVGTEDDAFGIVSRGFDVTVEMPIRARIARVGEDPVDHVLVLVTHHIASDGESCSVLARDLITAYVARHDGRAPEWGELALQYADYTLWQRDQMGDPRDQESVIGRQLAFWRSELDGLPDAIELPTDRPRPRVSSMRSGTVEFVVDGDVARAVESAARAQGATLFMAIHAALAVLLARMS
ncbi:hypothetical protein G3I15_29185, partial [Streptomyces sp. SID10244]|nr:hypothetical protein [Streptomyces sp. SID10244]